MALKADTMFYYCWTHTQESALWYQKGYGDWSTVVNWAGHTLEHVKQLHDTGLLSLINLPQA
jgi:hypothetical protein